MALTDEEFRLAVAKQVADMGWDGFMNICDNDEEEAEWLSNGGWSAIYDKVCEINIELLRSSWSHLDE